MTTVMSPDDGVMTADAVVIAADENFIDMESIWHPQMTSIVFM